MTEGVLPAAVEALRRRLFELATEAAAEAGLSWYWLQARPGSGPFDSGLLLERGAFPRLLAPLEDRLTATAARLILPGSEPGDPDPHPRLVLDGTTLEEPQRATLDCHQGIFLRLLLVDPPAPGGAAARLERGVLELRLRRAQARIWALLLPSDDVDTAAEGERGRERLAAAFERRGTIFAKLENTTAADPLPAPAELAAGGWLLLDDRGLPQDFPAACRLGDSFLPCPPADYSDWWFDEPPLDLLP
ncbi:MAG: hypothetical protein QM296_10095 [Bacillota bacterium]|nr:hypothetical protein [Bacillota bacterium]